MYTKMPSCLELTCTVVRFEESYCFLDLLVLFVSSPPSGGASVGWNSASNSEGRDRFFVREVQGRGGPLNWPVGRKL